MTPQTLGRWPLMSLPVEPMLPVPSIADRERAPLAPIAWRPLARKTVWFTAWFAAIYASLVCVLLLLYAFINPPASTLMIGQALYGIPMRQTWVPLERISPNVIKAVVISEDAQFCEHWGVDWEAMADAWADGGRGASTIPMQTVKNVFLWPGRNYLRKAVEVPLAHLATLVWSKRRMLEIYLNVAEWGPGIYGIEEASKRSFGRSAADLSPSEATLLAATLPSPIRRKASAPGRQTSIHASRVRRQFSGSESYLGCVLKE
jgi:monofunctional glycosyltransferase